MIITLKGANFSSSNIGTLSTWTIFTTLGSGATYSGNKTVDRGGAYSGTVTIADGYELGAAGVTVTMGGTDITSSAVRVSGNTITITISAVTGTVYITVPTASTSSGEETTYYTITYNYVDSNGATIQTSTTEQVVAGTSKTFTTSNAPSIEGYTVSSVSPTSATINSNTTVTYTYTANATSGTSYWISEKLTGNTIGSGTPTSLLGSQMFVIRDTNYIAELTGKTVESVAIALTNKEVTSGTLYIYLVDLSNEAPSNWELKDTITGWAGSASTIQIKDLNTPFVVPSGYTIGYKGGNLLGSGTVTNGHNRNEYYYDNTSDTSAAKLAMAPLDVKVKS